MTDNVQHVSSRHAIDVLTKMTALLKEEIDEFYLLFIYELKDLHAMQLQQQVKHINDFYNIIFKDDFKAYIVTASLYNQNEELYAAILHQARKKTAFNFTRATILYCLEDDQHVDIDGQEFNALFQLVEQTIAEKLKLNADESWEALHRWCVHFIKEKVIEELIVQLGVNQLQSLSNEQFNQLFFKTCSYSFINSRAFLDQLKEAVVNVYGEESVQLLQEVKQIVHTYMSKQPAATPPQKDIFIPNFISVPNFIVYQIIREALYEKAFSLQAQRYPIHRFRKGKTIGTLEIIPPNGQYEVANTIAQTLSPLDVDVIDILFALYIYQAKQPGDVVEVSISDILKMRGLREKIGGQGRRGGFEKKQQAQIIQSLQTIQSLFVTIEQLPAYKQFAKAGSEGRLFRFQTAQGEPYEINEDVCTKKITFTVDALFEQYLNGAQRQLALLPSVALQYHTSRMAAEKQLTRYLSWRWRTQAFKGDYLQPNKVHTLLQSMGSKLHSQAPMRTRERLEKTLDTLAQDGIIADWHYFKWDEETAAAKGWAKYWLNASIIIEPSNSIKKHYAKIESTKKQPATQQKPDDVALIGKLIAARRHELQLTLLQLAEILNVTAPYISNIEKNKVKPSAKLRDKMIKWLEQTELQAKRKNAT